MSGGIFRRHWRFAAALALGGAASALAPANVVDRSLVGADMMFAAYLVLTFLWMRGRSGDDLRDHFREADEGLGVIVGLSLSAVGISLYAIFQTLAATHDAGFAPRPWLALVSVPLGWASVHTLMAFHYARIFYTRVDRRTDTQAEDGQPEDTQTGDASPGQDAGGLDFPGALPEPAPIDFLYYSFTLGMTAQTSDVGVTSTRMRAATLAHSVLSFFYNAVIVALAVNAGLSLGQ